MPRPLGSIPAALVDLVGFPGHFAFRDIAGVGLGPPFAIFILANGLPAC